MELSFLFLVLPFFIYWCINEKVGLQLCIVFLLSIWTIFLYRYIGDKLPFNMDIRWIIIAVIFCGYLLLHKKIDAVLALGGGIRAYMITTAAVSFLMIIYRPGLETVLPAGVLLGIGAGYCMNKKYVGFNCSDVLERKGILRILTLAARFFIGIAVLAIITYRVEKVIEQLPESQNIFLYCFLCYAVYGLWVSIAAPWLFIKMRLAGSKITGTERKE